MAKVDYSKIFSFSKLNLFETCPQQYYFNYLDPEIAPIRKEFLKPRDFNIKGSAVHDAITLFYYLPKKKRNFDGLKECLKEAWYSEKDVFRKPPLGELGGFRNLNHERKTYIDSLKLLLNYLRLEEKEPDLFFVPVKTIKDSFEDYQKMIKPVSSSASISGKFDRIDKLESGKLRVVDFKTGKTSNNFFQLEFYKLLAEMNFNIPVDQVSFYCLAENKIKDYDVSGVKSEDIKKKILEKITKIEKIDKFAPNPTRLCNYCDFKELCPVFKQENEGN